MLCISTLIPVEAKTYERCKALASEIRRAHFYYFGVDFPHWYSIAQAEKESRCIHSAVSSDGIGSEGFAQITYRQWKERLERQGITEIKSLSNHAKAQAYINYYYHKQNPCQRLWATYQAYNGGGLVFTEIRKANSCRWEDVKEVCRRKDVCVWQTPQGCKQWRNACDINYNYSLTIYKLANKYRVGADSFKYSFW